MNTLDIPEVSKILKLSERTVRTMIQSGKLPAARIGWQWRIREEDVRALIEPTNQRAEEPAAAG